MSIVKVKILEHGKDLELPSYATPQSAGADLRSAEEVVIRSMDRVLISTGIAIALEDGYEAQVRPRSGLAIKHGITVLNSPGTIDADYRGEIKVILINLGNGIFTVNRGDRIAQLIIAPVLQSKFVIANDLEKTIRDDGGFGSTGE